MSAYCSSSRSHLNRDCTRLLAWLDGDSNRLGESLRLALGVCDGSTHLQHAEIKPDSPVGAPAAPDGERATNHARNRRIAATLAICHRCAHHDGVRRVADV